MHFISYLIMIMFLYDQNLYGLSSSKRGRLLGLDDLMIIKRPIHALNFDDYKGINYW